MPHNSVSSTARSNNSRSMDGACVTPNNGSRGVGASVNLNETPRSSIAAAAVVAVGAVAAVSAANAAAVVSGGNIVSGTENMATGFQNVTYFSNLRNLNNNNSSSTRNSANNNNNNNNDNHPSERSILLWSPKDNGGLSNLASAKRIRKELSQITVDPPPFCSAGLKDDNLYEWVSTIMGPPGSVYEDGVFVLDIHFTREYPFKPPRVTFRTPIYHCNINNQGYICLDILKQKWSPALTIANVLLSICSLLTDCNPSDPLVGSIAVKYLRNREEHDRTARAWTRAHAT